MPLTLLPNYEVLGLLLSEGELSAVMYMAMPTRGSGRAGQALLVRAMWTGGASYGLEPGLASKRGHTVQDTPWSGSRLPSWQHFSPDSNDMQAMFEVLGKKSEKLPSPPP